MEVKWKEVRNLYMPNPTALESYRQLVNLGIKTGTNAEYWCNVSIEDGESIKRKLRELGDEKERMETSMPEKCQVREINDINKAIQDEETRLKVLLNPAKFDEVEDKIADQ